MVVTVDEAEVLAAADRLLSEYPPASTDPLVFLRAQYDAGLAWVQNPHGYGGLGASIELQALVDDRLKEAGAPLNGRSFNAIGAGQCASTVLGYGSEDQKQRYLPWVFTGEAKWCQLFSEPGSGSDLASLATRAVRDGDEWIVNGQKVWTSGAEDARYALLLARTDPEAEKHAGTHRVRHRHGRPRRRGPAVAPDERRCRLQRSVHVERPHPRQRAAR